MSLPRSLLSRALADPRLATLPAWAKSLVSGTTVRAGRVFPAPFSLVPLLHGGFSALPEARQVVLDLRQIRHALEAAGVPRPTIEELPFSPAMLSRMLGKAADDGGGGPAAPAVPARGRRGDSRKGGAGPGSSAADGPAPLRRRRLGLLARLLCMQDSQKFLYTRPSPEFKRVPMDHTRHGCLGMARMVSVGTQTTPPQGESGRVM